MLLFGLFIWLNFSRLGSPDMFLYYLSCSFFVTAVILFFLLLYFGIGAGGGFLYSHVSISSHCTP